MNYEENTLGSFHYRFCWVVTPLSIIYVVLSIGYGHFVKGEQQQFFVIANVTVCLLFAAIYVELKTHRVLLKKNSIQSKSLLHDREIPYRDIQTAGVFLDPLAGARTLKIVSKTGPELEVHESLKEFDAFVEILKLLVENSGGTFQEPQFAS